MSMDEVVKMINDNQGVIAIVAIGISIVGGIITMIFKRDTLFHNSATIKAGRDISAGGDITVGHHNTKQTFVQNEEIPEFHLHLSGSGATKVIEGHAEKKSDKTLVLESIEIKGAETKLGLQFTKLTYLKNLNFPDALFTTREPQEIKVTVIYKTLDGMRYELNQEMKQMDRADGLFNLSLVGSPSIKKLE